MFFGRDKTVQDGDLVILYFTPQRKLAITVKQGEAEDTVSGVFEHDAIIGSEYGSTVRSKSQAKTCCIFRPTPELWTETLPHRTQILYSKDISLVIMLLEIKSGSVVFECGTGSGSLTHSLANTVYPAGHVYTFEQDETRSRQYGEEVHRHGFGQSITVTNRCLQNGFGHESVADAVFLDLPTPWVFLEHVLGVLKKDKETRIGCFVPSLEQMQRTADALEEHFHRVEIVETSQRRYTCGTVSGIDVVRHPRREKHHTGYLLFGSYHGEHPC
ncbi:MAG: tRNA(1-methyladenosine) methyltransferase subunit Gcd14 [Amphiamblys sp. WSBS2006]|nr:MAG: tRNA(1-methyladenosine) methyltransferase subunit Gcd14 [Amphiamblys sp. WSBS2006]